MVVWYIQPVPAQHECAVRSCPPGLLHYLLFRHAKKKQVCPRVTEASSFSICNQLPFILTRYDSLGRSVWRIWEGCGAAPPSHPRTS
eukprot:2442107-Rhodomonas_salina.1